MKFTIAEWDKASLGMDSYELIATEADSLSSVEMYLNEIDAKSDSSYTVLKVPSELINSFSQVHKTDLSYVETQLTLQLSSGMFKRYSKVVPYLSQPMEVVKVVTQEKLDNVLSEISKGIFISDRIALQKEFGVQVANARYRGWLENSFHASDVELMEFLDQGVHIGFLFVQKSGRYITGLLGGLYKNYFGSGLFLSCLVSAMNGLLRDKSAVYRAPVSSNNVRILNTYLSLGCQVATISYVFTRIRK